MYSSKVRWERQGINFTNSLRHNEIEGGLRIYNAGPSDAGLYTCSVASPAGELAKRDLQLNVLSMYDWKTCIFTKICILNFNYRIIYRTTTISTFCIPNERRRR